MPIVVQVAAKDCLQKTLLAEPIEELDRRRVRFLLFAAARVEVLHQLFRNAGQVGALRVFADRELEKLRRMKRNVAERDDRKSFLDLGLERFEDFRRNVVVHVVERDEVDAVNDLGREF